MTRTQELAGLTDEGLRWELEVGIPHELANTSNARRRGRLLKDRTDIEKEMQRRLDAGHGERMDLR